MADFYAARRGIIPRHRGRLSHRRSHRRFRQVDTSGNRALARAERFLGPDAAAVVGGFRRLADGRNRRLDPRSASGGQTPPVEPAPSLDVVGHVREHDGRAGACQADGADDQPHGPLLVREGMLDMRADRRFRRVRPRGPLRHRLSLRLAPVDAADFTGVPQKPLVLGRPIGAVGPDVRAGVARVDQALAQSGAVWRRHAPPHRSPSAGG